MIPDEQGLASALAVMFTRCVRPHHCGISSSDLGKLVAEYCNTNATLQYGELPVLSSGFITSALQLGWELSDKAAKTIGGVPTTPDPNTSEKVSQYKWEPYPDTNL